MHSEQKNKLRSQSVFTIRTNLSNANVKTCARIGKRKTLQKHSCS